VLQLAGCWAGCGATPAWWQGLLGVQNTQVQPCWSHRAAAHARLRLRLPALFPLPSCSTALTASYCPALLGMVPSWTRRQQRLLQMCS